MIKDPGNRVSRMLPAGSLMSRAAPVWQGAALALMSLATQASWAVNSLPGGPAVNQLDLHPPVTRIAAEEQSLHYMMLYICVAIFVAVFGVMFYSVFKHRKSKGAKAAD